MHSTQPSADPVGAFRGGLHADQPFARSLPWVLLIGGIGGLAAAFVLTIERFALEADADYIPSCSLNPVLNCGSIMESPQASLFGFPNSMLGLVGFTAVTATGAGMLAGARFARWYWLILQIGLTASTVFVHWLIIQSLYAIGSLCPYCMVVWAVTVPIFWYLTLWNLRRSKIAEFSPHFLATIERNHLVPVTVWILAVVGLIAVRFWTYWSSVL